MLLCMRMVGGNLNLNVLFVGGERTRGHTLCGGRAGGGGGHGSPGKSMGTKSACSGLD